MRYLARLAGETAAQDLLQDVLITIVRKVAFLRDPDLFRPWAYRVAGSFSRAARAEHRPTT